MTNLFVGSLPYETTSEQLQEMFEKVGKVQSATVIADKYSGRSRGFGFVEMSTEEESKKAVKELNGEKVGQRNIVVSEAKPRRDDRDSGGFKNDR